MIIIGPAFAGPAFATYMGRFLAVLTVLLGVYYVFPPPPPDAGRGMTATVYWFEAVVLYTLGDILAIYLGILRGVADGNPDNILQRLRVVSEAARLMLGTIKAGAQIIYTAQADTKRIQHRPPPRTLVDAVPPQAETRNRRRNRSAKSARKDRRQQT